MRIYNVIGYAIVVIHLFVAAYLAPEWLGPWGGAAIGFAYFLMSWFLGGLYLSDLIHLGISHRALDYKPWFMKAVTLLNSTIGVYVDPRTWVSRHRLHHRHADGAGDPNKLAADGFWRTLYLCMFPYPCTSNMATDEIFQSRTFRLVSHPVFKVLAPFMSCGFVWLIVRDWKFAVGVWISMRVFALWVNMIQNYWTHDRRFGWRRYDDADNAMNISDWFPVMATFSACWQNNHHHYAHMLRLSHAEGEFDFGYITVKAMAALGLVKPSKTGTNKPDDVPLAAITL